MRHLARERTRADESTLERGRFARQVAAGRTIVVTEHGQPVADRAHFGEPFKVLG
jgi:hypothetical protein